MTKEFGKLSTAQFQALIENVPALLEQLAAMEKGLADTPTSKFDDTMSGGFGGYCLVYELPFAEFLSLVVVAL